MKNLNKCIRKINLCQIKLGNRTFKQHNKLRIIKKKKFKIKKLEMSKNTKITEIVQVIIKNQ